MKFRIKGVIIPWKYHSKYSEGDTGEKMCCDWWMWLGKPFKINHYPRDTD